MSRTAVARTYADALLDLASRDDAGAEYLECLDEVVHVVRSESDFRAFLQTPAISLDEKKGVIREAFGGRYPESFVRFLLVVLEKRRQNLLPEIDAAYREMLDERSGRVRASVTLSIEPDGVLREEISSALSRALEAEVVPDFKVDESIIGGMVVRVGDRVLDGSVRRSLQVLRRELIEGARTAAKS
jgi:F-type H+-transporting ATPase subunit delta